MNLATGFDLFGSLGNSGEGFSGHGGEGRAEGELGEHHLLWEDFMPPLRSCAHLCHSICDATKQHTMRCLKMGTMGLAHVGCFIHSFVH